MKGFILMSKSKFSETYRTEDNEYLLSKNYHRYNGKRVHSWSVLKRELPEDTPAGVASKYMAIAHGFKDLRLAKSFIREQYSKQFSPVEN